MEGREAGAKEGLERPERRRCRDRMGRGGGMVEAENGKR